MTRRYNLVAIAALLWLAFIVSDVVLLFYTLFLQKFVWEQVYVYYLIYILWFPVIRSLEPSLVYLFEAILTGSAFLVFAYILLRFTDFAWRESADVFVPLPKKNRRKVELTITKIRRGICHAVSPEERPKKREPPPIEALRD